MALMVTYDEPNVTREDYDAVRTQVGWENAPPVGCLLHMSYFDDAGFHTVDIWDSQAKLDAYLTKRFNPALKILQLPDAAPKATDLHLVAASPSLEKYFLPPAARD
ncbi:MAG: hypothetical protein V4820_09230 [Pseudomonadota bacterium]